MSYLYCYKVLEVEDTKVRGNWGEPRLASKTRGSGKRVGKDDGSCKRHGSGRLVVERVEGALEGVGVEGLLVYHVLGTNNSNRPHVPRAPTSKQRAPSPDRHQAPYIQNTARNKGRAPAADCASKT